MERRKSARTRMAQAGSASVPSAPASCALHWGEPGQERGSGEQRKRHFTARPGQAAGPHGLVGEWEGSGPHLHDRSRTCK